MGRAILTEVAIRRLKPPATGRLEVWDAALPGFAVRLTPNGRRSYVLVTRLRGRPIRVTLGTWPAVSLATARDLAREAIQAVAKGEDPRRRTRAAAPDTVAAIGAEYLAKHARVHKRSWQEDERKLRVYVLPVWGTRRLAEIGRPDVVALMDHIATANGPYMANRVLALVKTLCTWALDRGRIAAHPAVGLASPGAETSRTRVLADPELRALWPAWSTMAYPFGVAFKLLALTGARRGEVGGMAWAELDLVGRTWEIPAARSKNKAALVVPLVPMAVDLLASVPRLDGTNHVFVARRRAPIRNWDRAVARASRLAGVTGWSAHDLRRTVRTNLSKLGIAADIAERVLGHTLGGVRGAYDLHSYMPEKRAALEQWAAHLAHVVAAEA